MSKLGTCPYCGFVASRIPAYLQDGDLVTCSKCNGRIDVVKVEGRLEMVKSTDITYGAD